MTNKKTAMKVNKMSQEDSKMWDCVDSQCKAMGDEPKGKKQPKKKGPKKAAMKVTNKKTAMKVKKMSLKI